PGIGAEERGQSEAIGACLAAMSRARVPIIATIIGEGGSGGALALGVANRVLVMEYGTDSVITPEGRASILWKDRGRADGGGGQHGHAARPRRARRERGGGGPVPAVPADGGGPGVGAERGGAGSGGVLRL